MAPRSFYVFYSLLGDIIPTVYRTKEACLKQIKTNPYHQFFQCKTQTEANELINSLKQNQKHFYDEVGDVGKAVERNMYKELKKKEFKKANNRFESDWKGEGITRENIVEILGNKNLIGFVLKLDEHEMESINVNCFITNHKRKEYTQKRNLNKTNLGNKDDSKEIEYGESANEEEEEESVGKANQIKVNENVCGFKIGESIEIQEFKTDSPNEDAAKFWQFTTEAENKMTHAISEDIDIETLYFGNQPNFEHFKEGDRNKKVEMLEGNGEDLENFWESIEKDMDRISNRKEREMKEDEVSEDGKNIKVFNEMESLRELLGNYEGIYR